MHRNILGAIALVLLLSGGVGLLLGYSANSQTGMAAGVGLRAGLVLGALWMAYPQLISLVKSAPKWMLGVAAIVVLVLVVNRNGLMLVVPALLILGLLQLAVWIFKPMPRKKPRPRRAPEKRER